MVRYSRTLSVREAVLLWIVPRVESASSSASAGGAGIYMDWMMICVISGGQDVG